MRAVIGEVMSSNPISLSKAAAVLSRFAASETGARPDVAAYLRRTVTAFDELVAVHREIRAHRKMSRVEKKEGAIKYEDKSRWMMKNKKKEKSYYEGESCAGNSIPEPQVVMGGSDKKKAEALRFEKKSDERRYWKENKRKEDRLLEVDGIDLVSESLNSERKKKKRLDAQQGEVNGEMKQHEGKKKKKRRIIDNYGSAVRVFLLLIL